MFARLTTVLIAITMTAAISAVPVEQSFTGVVEQAAAAKQQPQKNKYATGRVKPKNLVELKLRASVMYADMIAKLPKVTSVTWDCRTLGIVPPIVDQGNCGSCWDFSGTSIVTSAFMVAMGTGAPGPLSEQYTLDCGNNGGCNGDDNTTVLQWAKTTGLPTTVAYSPYRANPGGCKSGVTLYKITDWTFCDGGQGSGVTDTQLIKNAMVKYGPIGVAIAADDAFMNTPAGQVFQGSGSTQINHDVVLVGWDDTKGTWLLRNSWGTGWCDQGYCWIKYGANLVGTEAVVCWVGTTPPVPPQPPVPPVPPVGGAPVITSTLTATAVVGIPFTYQIAATNNPTLLDAFMLPAGFSCSNSGLITGTPTAAGSSAITLLALNTQGAGTATLNLTVTTTPTNTVTITLTPDQVQSVLSQANGIVVSPEVTLKMLNDILTRSNKTPTPMEPAIAK